MEMLFLRPACAQGPVREDRAGDVGKDAAGRRQGSSMGEAKGEEGREKAFSAHFPSKKGLIWNHNIPKLKDQEG